MRILLACLVVLVGSLLAHAEDVAAPKLGSFERVFQQRSPHSEMKSLAKRLSIKDATADYDLGREPCLVFVPETYDAAKPIGLIVLLNYKPATELPYTVLPQIAEANCAVVVPKSNAQPTWAKVGLALDIAHNMTREYKVDPKRVFIFGSDLEYAAQRASLNYPEVFTGGFWLNYAVYRPVKRGDGSMWRAELPKPDPKALALAKTHPFVMASLTEQPQSKDFVNAFRADGFKLIKQMIVTTEQHHYPNYTTDWLPGVLQFLDEGVAKIKLPATKPAPATRPAVSRPALTPGR